jgi:hypothetical protein
MPAETHQLGCSADTVDVAALLWVLLDDPDAHDSKGARRTLAELGFDAAGLVDLWAAVCEEFGERSLDPELDPGAHELTMTVETAAAAMAGLLAHGGDGH